MDLDDVTPLILTYNEAPNIGRTLEKLTWAPKVLVVDSFSTDATLQIAASFPNAAVIQRPFDSFAGQCNFGLENIATPWVLSMDADYVLTDPLVEELKSLAAAETTVGYRAKFKYCIHGRSLRACLYPPRVVLYRRERAKYQDVGHGHRVMIEGDVGWLHSPILHDDRKPMERWLSSQLAYARQEASHLLGADPAALGWPDRLRRWVWPAAPAVFFYSLLVKGCILDGWRGWFYTLQRTYAEVLLSLELMDRRLGDGVRSGGNSTN